MLVKKNKTKDKILSSLIIKRVDGREVRTKYDSDFSQAGHHYRYNFVPENEIWIENRLDKKEQAYCLFHELIEMTLMKDRGYDYEKAHQIAKNYEDQIRSQDK
jgi:hypothetical protein